jgi:hypothetical protein
MALLAVGCGYAAQPAHEIGRVHHVGVVPWVDRPAPAYVERPPHRPTAAYEPCRARQLIGRPGHGGPAAGTVFQEVRLTNRGDRPCTLSGGPIAVTGISASDGTTTLTRVARDGFNLVGPGPANLRPGHSGWVTLAYADHCPVLTSGGKADYRTVFIVLDSGLVRVDFPAALNLVCGVTASMFGAPQPAPPSSRSALNVLAATLAVPGTFSAGATARYAVTLVNHSGALVRLSPCPSYTEYLLASSGPGPSMNVVRRYYLNCAAARLIPAHGSVTFAIRTPVPGETGSAKLDWQMQDTDVAVADIVTIGGVR